MSEKRGLKEGRYRHGDALRPLHPRLDWDRNIIDIEYIDIAMEMR